MFDASRARTCSSISSSVSARSVRPRAGTSASATGARRPAGARGANVRGRARGGRGRGPRARSWARCASSASIAPAGRRAATRPPRRPGHRHDRRRDRAVPRHVRGEDDVGVGQDDRRREHRTPRRARRACGAGRPATRWSRTRPRPRRRPRSPRPRRPRRRVGRHGVPGVPACAGDRGDLLLGQAASARERASSTSEAITTLEASASGCHCTPRRVARAGQLDRLGQVVLRRPARHLQAVADPVDGLVVMRLRRDPDTAGRARGERTGDQTDVVVAERARDPPVVLVADERRGRAGAASRRAHVEDLHAAAHAEHRHVAREGAGRERQLERVAQPGRARRVRVGLRAVGLRCEVGAAGEQERVEVIEGLVRVRDEVRIGREQRRDAACALDRLDVAHRQDGGVHLPHAGPCRVLDRGQGCRRRGAPPLAR